jgi:hypothetical protein
MILIMVGKVLGVAGGGGVDGGGGYANISQVRGGVVVRAVRGGGVGGGAWVVTG